MTLLKLEVTAFFTYLVHIWYEGFINFFSGH